MRPFRYIWVSKGREYICRDCFTFCQFNDPNGSAIDRIAEEQQFGIGGLGVFVNAAVFQADGRVGFNVNKDLFQIDHIL